MRLNFGVILRKIVLYVRFLIYCHDRRLLQQIGGRDRFIHRELLDHFAGMEN
jgi:hypothetical protein